MDAGHDFRHVPYKHKFELTEFDITRFDCNMQAVIEGRLHADQTSVIFSNFPKFMPTNYLEGHRQYLHCMFACRWFSELRKNTQCLTTRESRQQSHDLSMGKLLDRRQFRRRMERQKQLKTLLTWTKVCVEEFYDFS